MELGFRALRMPPAILGGPSVVVTASQTVQVPNIEGLWSLKTTMVFRTRVLKHGVPGPSGLMTGLLTLLMLGQLL